MKNGIGIEVNRSQDGKDIICGDRVVITIYDANVIGMAYPDAIEKILSSTVRELVNPVEVECTKTQSTS